MKSKVLLLLLTLLGAVSALAQGTITLIGPSIRNGSFEDGGLAPWTPPDRGASIIQDSSFATHGEWYAVVSETANSSVVRPSIFNKPAADSNGGRTFALAFDARNGTFPFEGIRVFFAALDNNGIVKFTTNTFSALPPQGWGTYQAEYQAPEVWDGGSLSLGLQFENMGAEAGSTYRGYLDNILLQQIPEPSVYALCGLGAILCAARLLTRRHNEFGKQRIDPLLS